MKKLICLFAVAVCLASVAWAAPARAPQGELIFPLQGKECHGSSIVQCPDGNFLACWFYGSGERGANDDLIQGARLKKGRTTWGPVFTMADTRGFPDCNPVLFIDAHKRLWLFWISVRANQWQDSLLMFRRAERYQGRGAPHWSWQGVIGLRPGDEFAKGLAAGFQQLHPVESMWGTYAPKYSTMLINAAQDKLKRQLGWMTRIHPLQLANGRVLLPLYSDGFNLSLVAISDDNCNTWHASKPMVGLGNVQPSLVQKKDGTVVAFCRDNGNPPYRVQVATSKDNGETWSVTHDIGVPNPGSSLEVIKLKDGRWVMCCNDTEDGRYRLALLMSDDEGQTWKWKRDIENAPKGKGSYSYPSLIQARDGRLHMTYTYSVGQNSIKHLAVDPDWIAQGQ